MVLGDGKEADIRGTAPAAEGGGVDLFPDGGNVAADLSGGLGVVGSGYGVGV